MEPITIVINGFPGAGKDTFVDILNNISKSIMDKKEDSNSINNIDELRIHNISSIDIVKHYAILLGWDGEKTPLMRNMLAEYKVFLEKYFQIPSKSLYRDIDYITQTSEAMEYKNVIIFIHIREPECIKTFIDKYPNTKTLFIDTDNNIDTRIHNDSDLHVRDYEYDYVIKNDYDMDHFTEKAKDFIKQILGE